MTSITEKVVDRIEKKVFSIERKCEKMVAVNARLKRRVEDLENENEWLTQENAVQNKRTRGEVRTNPKVKHFEYIGYVGTSIGAKDIFVFRTVERWSGDTSGFIALDINGHCISKTKDNEAWNTVKITVDILTSSEKKFVNTK